MEQKKFRLPQLRLKAEAAADPTPERETPPSIDVRKFGQDVIDKVEGQASGLKVLDEVFVARTDGSITKGTVVEKLRHEDGTIFVKVSWLQRDVYGKQLIASKGLPEEEVMATTARMKQPVEEAQTPVPASSDPASSEYAALWNVDDDSPAPNVRDAIVRDPDAEAAERDRQLRTSADAKYNQVMQATGDPKAAKKAADRVWQSAGR